MRGFSEEIQALKNKRMFRAAAEGHLGCLKAEIETGADVNILDEPTSQRKEILDAEDAVFSGLIDKHAVLLQVIFLHLSVIHSVHGGGGGGYPRMPCRSCPGGVYGPGGVWSGVWTQGVGGWVRGVGKGGGGEGWLRGKGDPPLFGGEFFFDFCFLWGSPHPSPSGSRVKHMVKERPVRILLECILVADEYPDQYNRNDPPQKTALIHAAENGNNECVELLINSGAEVDKTDTSARTPLMAAAENGHDGVVELLIKAEADVNLEQQDEDEHIDTGFTAVMFAEKNGHKSCVKLLVDAGAEVNKTKKNKKARRY